MILWGAIIPFTVVLVGAFYCVICTQNTYKFVHEYAELSEYNPDLVHINVVCNKLSRTTVGVNITFTPLVNIASDGDLKVKIVGYQFRSNEYRYGPIDFEMGACSLIESTRDNMPGILTDSNVTGCPLQGPYYIHNMAPDASPFPPNIPEGKWMLKLIFLFKGERMFATLQWYATVEKISRF